MSGLTMRGPAVCLIISPCLVVSAAAEGDDKLKESASRTKRSLWNFLGNFGQQLAAQRCPNRPNAGNRILSVLAIRSWILFPDPQWVRGVKKLKTRSRQMLIF